MAQNIYDDAAFFEGYSRFPRSAQGLSAAAEWPSLRAMLPPVNGLDILDLGCGFGYFARWAVQQGAARVTGLDLSENMLAEAAKTCAGLPVTLARADLDNADFGADQFDLVFSSLVVHYIADFDAFLARVRTALKADGRFVFSMEHPVFAARANPEFAQDAEGRQVAAVREYLREGERQTNWIAEGVVKHHRLIATTIMALKRAGFDLDAIEEWAASDDDVAAHPEWEKERYEPMFLLFATHAAPKP
jgi:SAM-dependent methyltransferase